MGEEASAPNGCTFGSVTRTRLIDIGVPVLLAVVAVVEVLTGSDIDAPWPITAMFALGTTLPAAVAPAGPAAWCSRSP